MRRLHSLLTVPLAALAFHAAAQDIAFEKYALPNGMTVILHEDHALPVVSVNTWFRVGSKDEPAGRSGFAHLFEHLMFMGTDRVPGNQFDAIMESGGGSNNASTSFDRTNYFSSGPASLLPTLLWLDADRLEDLGRTMTQEKLDRQRDVVRNERRQSIENAPYGKSELEITAIMFPGDHPYHNEVIGTHADLEAATVQNVKDFFGAYYVPNNASLVVAGDFDAAAVKPLIAGLFGTIPRGATPEHKSAPPVTLGRVVRGVTLDQVQQPRIQMCYHSPAQMAEGDAEMDLVAALLTQGKSARLYKRLILDDDLASEVSAYQASAALQSVFRIDVTPLPGVDLDLVERVVDEEIARLLRDGIAADELSQRQATVELAKTAALQSVARKADKLNEYEFFWGNPGGFKRDLDRYRNATPETVLAWARQVLTQDSRLIMRVLPDQPERPPSPRDKRPADLSPGAFAPPTPHTLPIKGAPPVMLWSNPQLPLVSVRVLFTPGGPLDPPALAGRSALTAQMLGEGAGPYSAEQFADRVQSLGAVFTPEAGAESAGVSLLVVKRNAAEAVRLLALALREPAMTERDWDRVRTLHVEELRRDLDDPMTVAGRVGQRLLFGDTSPYAWPVAGSISTVEKLSLDQVRAWRSTLFAPSIATILVSGDVSPQECEGLLAPLLDGWSGGPPRAKPTPHEPPARAAMRVAIVDRPGAVQTVIRYVAPGVRRADDRRVACAVLNTILGGTFTSRLNQNLREDKGYTYGAGSRFVMEPGAGYFVARASVIAEATGKSLAEFEREFARIRAGDVSADEVAKAAESIRTDLIQSFEGVGGPLDHAADLIPAGLAWSTVASDLAATGKVTADQLNRSARPAFPIEGGVLVLVGDKAAILPQLAGLNLPTPVEYKADGAPARTGR